MLCPKTRFETEAQGNQEMAYYTTTRKDDVLSGITFFFSVFLLGLVVIGGLGVDITPEK